MKLNKISELSQIFSSIAVIGTLIFIGIQIGQNTKATRASIRQSLASNDITYLMSGLNSEIIAEAIDNRQNGIDLSTKEIDQMIQQQYVNFMVFENAFYNYQEGFLNPELWNRYCVIIASLMHDSPYAIKSWNMNRMSFTESFRIEVKRIMDNVYVKSTEHVDSLSKADN